MRHQLSAFNFALARAILILSLAPAPALAQVQSTAPVAAKSYVDTQDAANATATAAEKARAQAAEGANATAIGNEATRAQGVEATKAPLASPAFTGTPVAPTALAGTSSTQIATTAFAAALAAAEQTRAQGAEALLLPKAGGTLTGPLSGTTATFSGPASASSLFATGALAGVGGITATAVKTAALWSIPAGGTNFPTITVSAPQAPGGVQATVALRALTLNSYGSIVGGGSGYAVGDVVSPAGGTVADQTAQFSVTSIGTGGAITGLSSSRLGRYSSLIPDTVSVSLTTVTGSGSGASVHGLTWIMLTNDGFTYVTIGAAGSGYKSATVTFGVPTGVTLLGGSPDLTITLSNPLALTGGAGQILLDGTGTNLGVGGATGSPVIARGAQIDGSGVRTALTTAGYTVPANTSLVRFTQAGTIASATVTLPTALADGQPVQFVNQAAGAVTALTFSPAVQGWTNGSQLNAGPGVGVRIRWDTTAAAWFRE